jgi:hypothetical protein
MYALKALRTEEVASKVAQPLHDKNGQILALPINRVLQQPQPIGDPRRAPKSGIYFGYPLVAVRQLVGKFMIKGHKCISI